MTAKEMAGKKNTGKSKRDPWPEEQVTSMASQHIGSIHHHLDQLNQTRLKNAQTSANCQF